MCCKVAAKNLAIEQRLVVVSFNHLASSQILSLQFHCALSHGDLKKMIFNFWEAARDDGPDNVAGG